MKATVNASSSAGRSRGPSLTVRLAVAVTLILALAASGALYLSFEYGRQAADNAYDRLLTGASLQIAERASVSDGKIAVDLPSSAFELLGLARSDRIFYRVIGPDGKTLTGYDDLPLPAAPNGKETQIYSLNYSGEEVRAAVTMRQIAERSVSGTVKIIVAQTVRERSALASDITTKAAILIGVAALAIIVLALFAVRYALSPLTRVERALLSREPNDLSPFVIETPRELETIVQAINRFTGRLDRRISSVQAFVADAAHQLRTPITAIRAQAQLAAGEQAPDRLRRISKRILDRSISVSRLADQLLSQAMVTHRGDAAKREPVDLRRVAIEAEEETRRMDDQNRLDVLLDLPEDPVIVSGDRFSLREAVKNLITNAQLHGAPPFAIRVRNSGGKAHIAVMDSGTGITPALRVTIGKRFVQSGSSILNGAGLGLAIASEVAEFHGGELILEDLPDGFSIGLGLPAVSERT
jgi:two-component system sensor histidine kinase TctE